MATSLYNASNCTIDQTAIKCPETIKLVESTLLPTYIGLSFNNSLCWTILICALTVPISIYLYCDFRAFLALGPGGTPSTIAGYVRVKLLSLLALRDPYKFDAVVPTKKHGSIGHLIDLPDRGQRPVTRGIAPHRQMTQRAGPELYQKLAEAVTQMGVTSNDLRLGTSCFEKHSTGLFSLSPMKVTCEGEICHIHPSDGSMHLTLHPADVKLVLDTRWGERHPLARGDRLAYFVPECFLMIYAPRTENDMEVIMWIVKAAAWFVGGGGAVKEWAGCQEMAGGSEQ